MLKSFWVRIPQNCPNQVSTSAAASSASADADAEESVDIQKHISIFEEDVVEVLPPLEAPPHLEVETCFGHFCGMRTQNDFSIKSSIKK